MFLFLFSERGSICLCFCRFTEDAYVLAYAAILLNTTLHNSNAKNQHLSLADEKTFVETMLDFDKDTNLSEEIIRVSWYFPPLLNHVFMPHIANRFCTLVKTARVHVLCMRTVAEFLVKCNSANFLDSLVINFHCVKRFPLNIFIIKCTDPQQEAGCASDPWFAQLIFR